MMVREVKQKDSHLDIRVVLLGDHDVGKSTLISVLLSGKDDDGMGLARMRVL